MHSTPQKESTFVPDQMAGSSTTPVSEPRQMNAKVLIRDMLFAGDAGVATHTQEELQSLMDCFPQACKDFGLTISLKKANVLEQDTEAPPVITIDDYELDAVSQFTYLGSTTETTHRCDVSNKDCHSHIGLFCHKRRCYIPA